MTVSAWPEPRATKPRGLPALVVVILLVVTCLASVTLTTVALTALQIRRALSQSDLDQAKNATVQILAMSTAGTLVQSGSGVMVDGHGLLLTAAHVVDPSVATNPAPDLVPISYFYVSTFTGDDESPVPAYVAKPVTSDRDLDLAVMRIVARVDGKQLDPAALPRPLSIGRSSSVHAAEPVSVLGYPAYGDENRDILGSPMVVTTGPVRSERADVITSATRVGPGSSGGAVIDADGKLIGIVKDGGNPRSASLDGAQSMPLAISTAAERAHDLIEQAKRVPTEGEAPKVALPDGKFHAQAAGWDRADKRQCPGVGSLNGVTTGDVITAKFVVEGLANGTPFSVTFYGGDTSSAPVGVYKTTWVSYKAPNCLAINFTMRADTSTVVAVFEADLGADGVHRIENPVQLP
ncbi:MAG: serine protease [Nocardiaceae bacterium]|nr:serine protease [Nocardiaceae bacterium]